MQKLLTVVVPIYKVEKYLNKCLDSLIVPDSQMKQLEVICVNDGTPDNSAIMAKEYEKRYPNTFKVIDKENGGHGSAWNMGVNLSTGKYLRFLDSDDWLTNLSDFMKSLELIDADMVFTDLQIVYENTNSLGKLYTCCNAFEANKIYFTDKYDWQRARSIYDGHNYTNFHMCTYRTSMLKKHNPIFLEKIFYDDEILMVLPLCYSKTFVYINFPLYNYLKGRQGQTVDVNVRQKSIGFDIKVKKQMVNFYHTNPVGNAKVDKELRYIIDKKVRMTLLTITLLPFRDGIGIFKEFCSWLDENDREFYKNSNNIIFNLPSNFLYLFYHYSRIIQLKIRSIFIK